MFLTLREAASRIGLSPETVRRSPHISKVKPAGGHWRVPVSEVERILASGTVAKEAK